MSIRGQSVVVTGAAQGIGECVARTLSDAGAKLLLADIQEEKVAGVAAELGCESIGVDVADPKSAESMIERAMTLNRRIDALINIAGIDAPYIDALDVHTRALAEADRCRSQWAMVVHRRRPAPHGETGQRSNRHDQLGRCPRRITQHLTGLLRGQVGTHRAGRGTFVECRKTRCVGQCHRAWSYRHDRHPHPAGRRSEIPCRLSLRQRWSPAGGRRGGCICWETVENGSAAR